MNFIKASCVGAVAALAFFFLARPNLSSQGMYYDELHQAPAAFYYLGSHPVLFTYPPGGPPMLNMPYSGAMKSTAYGFYLRYVNPHFTVSSWRLLGILFVVAGLLAFYLTAGVFLPFTSLGLFGALLLTDTSAILMTRHDAGPVALSLALRLAFLGVWISLALGRATHIKYCLAGLIVGVALFEKLSAVVLLIPLIILVCTTRTRTRQGWISAALGAVAGASPLILVNLASYRSESRFISLADLSTVRPLNLHDAVNFAYDFLGLGQGARAQKLILGVSLEGFVGAEVYLAMAFVLTIAAAALWHRSSNRLLALAGFMALSYVLVGIALFLLPKHTTIHHWIVGTPFQYLAIALAAAGVRTPIRRGAFLVAVAALLTLRLPQVAAVEASLASGKASAEFDPAFTRVAELAALKSHEAVFVTAGWGTAVQLYCMGNGQDDLVYELSWSTDAAASVKFVLEEARRRKKHTLYVLVTDMAPQVAETSASVLHSVVVSPGWREVPVEKEFGELGRVQVRKFIEIQHG